MQRTVSIHRPGCPCEKCVFRRAMSGTPPDPRLERPPCDVCGLRPYNIRDCEGQRWLCEACARDERLSFPSPLAGTATQIRREDSMHGPARHLDLSKYSLSDHTHGPHVGTYAVIDGRLSVYCGVDRGWVAIEARGDADEGTRYLGQVAPEPLVKHEVRCPTCQRFFCEVYAPASWSKFVPKPVCPGCTAEGR